MKYRISEKPTGVKITTPIAEIESSTIKDFCYVDGLGILFIYDQCIGLIPSEGDPVVPWRGEEGISRKEFHESRFDDPCSLAYNPKTRQLYVLEKGGTQIRVLDELSTGSDLISCEDKKLMSVLFSNVERNGDARISFGGYQDIVWTASNIHRCMMHSDSSLSVLAGDGRGRYAVANSPKECSFHNPSDVIVVNNEVLVADCDNHCVRRIKNNGISLFCGNPSIGDMRPRRMALQDNIVYILSGNSIKSFPMSNKNGLMIYESDNIIDLTNGKKGLLILEEIK